MKVSDFEQVICMQFDSLIKRVTRDTVRDYNKQLVRRSKHEILFSNLGCVNFENIGSMDEYEWDSVYFEIFDAIGVKVYDEKLAIALKKLKERKRLIILMFYFLGLSDAEIGKVLSINRKTSFRNRKSALEEIKKFLQEE